MAKGQWCEPLATVVAREASTARAIRGRVEESQRNEYHANRLDVCWDLETTDRMLSQETRKVSQINQPQARSFTNEATNEEANTGRR